MDTMPEDEVNVVLITPTLFLGGAERWILSLAKNFKTMKVSHIINFSGQSHPLLDSEAKKICTVLDKPSIEEIVDICSKAKFIITWGCRQLKEYTKKAVCPVVDVSHNDPSWATQILMIQKTCLGATHFVGVSNTAKKSFPDGVVQKAVAIYNGIEPERVVPTISREEQRQIWGIDNQKKILLFVSRITKEKNPQIVSETIDRLPDDWECVCVASGLYLQEFKDKCSKRIKFVEPSLNVGNFFNAADVLILPSDFEGFPLVLLEAWLAGIPTVTTRYDTYKEIQSLHGELSWSIPVKPFVQEAVDAVISATKEDARVNLAQNIVRTNYLASTMADNWEKWIQKVQDERTLYIILTTGRSGSSWLCQLLTSTRCLGNPKEYLNPSNFNDEKMMFDYPWLTLKNRELLDAIMKNTSTLNGVVGIKSNLQYLINSGILRTYQAPIKYVYLTRKDKIGQAISLERAFKSQKWCLYKNESVLDDNLGLDINRILSQMLYIKNEEDKILEFLKNKNYLEIAYEDLLENELKTVGEIAKFIGVNKEFEKLESNVVPQRDQKTEEWRSEVVKWLGGF